jgi:hypothetical protein
LPVRGGRRFRVAAYGVNTGSMPDIAELPVSRRERNDLSATNAYRIDPWPVIRDKPVRERRFLEGLSAARGTHILFGGYSLISVSSNPTCYDLSLTRKL